jgi:hypothetical protein
VFPANIAKHRQALLEILAAAVRDPARRTALRTRGVSMEPLVRARDEVVVEAVRPEGLAPGDLIAYRSGDLLLVHRLVAAGEREGRRLLWEKGDRNLYLTPLEPEQVLGRVVTVATPGGLLDLRTSAHRRLARWVAGYGLQAVRVYGGARALGARWVRPGSLPSRAARLALAALLQAPLRVALVLVRRLGASPRVEEG